MKVVDRTYTDRDQLDQIDYDSVMVANSDYDAGMRETFRQHGNGLFTRRVYGRDDNLVTAIVNETSLNAANRPDASFAYTYDANKNVVSETTGTTSSPMEHYSWTTAGGGTPGYDAEDRLTYWTRSSSGSGSIHTQAWPINYGSTGLSLVGDWTTVDINGVTQSRTHNAVHELLTINSTGLTHDAKGNLTRDVGDTVDRFTWDFDNRMQAADVDQDGTDDLTFTYDALGRRVSKNDAPGSTHTVYICTGLGMGQVVCEYLANDDPSTTAPQRAYVYGSYVDEPLMMEAPDGNPGSAPRYYYHANRQYSVTAMTDASGAVVERYAYSPYGVTTILAPNGSTPRATSSVGNPYMYTGRRLDKEFATSSEDAIYYYRARYYLPPLARFGSRDPLKYIDGMSVYGGYHAMRWGLDAAGMAWSATECTKFFGPSKTWDAVAEKYRKARSAQRDAEAIVDQLKRDGASQDVIDEAVKVKNATRDFVSSTREAYRFWRYMRSRGCGCCALRMAVNNNVESLPWDKGFSKAKAASRLLKSIGKKVKKYGGRALPIGDLTGALKSYDKLKEYVKALTMGSALHHAKSFGEIYDDCPSLNSQASSWSEAVDDNGKPIGAE